MVGGIKILASYREDATIISKLTLTMHKSQLAFVGSYAALSPAAYWKSVLPDTPMPKANLTMPPKPSRKSKKLSQIEDNDELRLSLMQRSMPQPQPQPQPQPLVLLTDMSPPPPPPTFEIRDLPPRSSAPNTATAPPVDTTIPSATASTTASNASTGTSVARSIRCKDLDLNVSGTSASKKRRGPVIGAKTQQMVRVGGKIVVEYFDEHRGPAIEAIHSLISHDIGSCVRDRVPMLAEIYAELPKDHKRIVYDYLSLPTINFFEKNLNLV
ncbi:hypothetical protein LguiA_015690 [Lonicera macranthoides]